MKYLWPFFNTFQLIIYMTLFDVQMPIEVSFFLSSLLNLVELNAIDRADIQLKIKEKISTKLWSFTDWSL